jgi:serine-type D-Ala-D-Ala carboxypeptidase/endopeptidase
MMVLSYALAKRSGTDFETLLRERLLLPLGMSDTYITRRPSNVRLAQGHLSNAMPAEPWKVHVDLAGAGGVRATLPDMVRYLEGQLGTRESQITPVLALTQRQVASVGGHTTGMNWEILSSANIANGHTIIMHPGGTGGYSSFVAFRSRGEARRCRAQRHRTHRCGRPPYALCSGCTCSIPPGSPARRAQLRPLTSS